MVDWNASSRRGRIAVGDGAALATCVAFALQSAQSCARPFQFEDFSLRQSHRTRHAPGFCRSTGRKSRQRCNPRWSVIEERSEQRTAACAEQQDGGGDAQRPCENLVFYHPVIA